MSSSVAFLPCQDSDTIEDFPKKSTLLSPDAAGGELPRMEDWAGKTPSDVLRLLSDVSYWSSICPELHVCDEAGFQRSALAQHDADSFVTGLDTGALRERMIADGYFQVPAPSLRLRSAGGEARARFDFELLANCVVKLLRMGWPPTFLIVFDEAWELARHCARLVQETTGGNANNLDLLIWYIDPNRDQSGFAPHRDRQPADSPATFRPDGSPMYATCWLPFTDACSDNSCLFVLPKWADPGYTAGDPDDSVHTPLELALRSKEDYQNIRCLAAPAGSACVFSHRTIHWGSRGRKGYHTARVAFSVAASDDRFEEAYFSRSEHLPFPPLRLRVALACAQMLIYHERFNFSAKLLRLFYRLFEAQVASFSQKYAQQVQFEFISATASALPSESPAAASQQGNDEEAEEDGDDDDTINMVLEAMLKRESAGFADVVDDFDVSEGRTKTRKKRRRRTTMMERMR